MLARHGCCSARENFWRVCRNYLTVLSLKRPEDQRRETLSPMHVLHNWVFQPLAARMICSNVLRTSLRVSSPIQDKYIKKKREKKKLGTRLTTQACLFHDTHVFSITLLPDIQEKTGCTLTTAPTGHEGIKPVRNLSARLFTGLLLIRGKRHFDALFACHFQQQGGGWRSPVSMTTQMGHNTRYLQMFDCRDARSN